MVDYSAAATIPTEDELSAISALAEKQVNLEQAIVEKENELKKLKDEYTEVRTQALPEAMRQVGLEEFRLANGVKISVKDEINVHIKNANQPQAYTWLREHGHGDIIKDQVTLFFADNKETVKDVVQEFVRTYDLDYSAKESIHANTLKAWTKKQLELGEELPEELINVFRYSVAKVILPKSR